MKLGFVALSTALAMAAAPAMALDFSFAGGFLADDDVQPFSFTVGADSTVTFITYSYAGGMQANGNLVAAGGFDPILAVFDSTGAKVGRNDDGSSTQVPADPVTGSFYDTYLELALTAGDYTVIVTQYSNFNITDSFPGSFELEGNPTFTSIYSCSNGQFCDVNGANRTNAWAFDILNVAQATAEPPITSPGEVPLPAAAPLLVGALGGLGLIARRRRAA